MGWVRILVLSLCFNLEPCLDPPNVVEVGSPFPSKADCEIDKPEGQLCAREDWLKGVTR